MTVALRQTITGEVMMMMNRRLEVSERLDAMVNAWYETPEIQRLLSTQLTAPRMALTRKR